MILQDVTMRGKFVRGTWDPSVLFLTTACESQNKFNYKKENMVRQGLGETIIAEKFRVIHFYAQVSYLVILMFTSIGIADQFLFRKDEYRKRCLMI